MKLYLMRHGEALHPAVDPQMRLSPRGMSDAQKTGEHLKALGAVINAVWHSPKARAVETAQCVADVLGLDRSRLELQQELVPEGDTERVYSRIENARQSAHFHGLLIVSHMPFLPQLTYRIAGNIGKTDFETASAACFEYAGGLWTRQWVQDPARL